jgi:hypothetical protein
MDLQYVPAVLTPAKKDKALEMVEAISELAGRRRQCFPPLAFMKGLYQVDRFRSTGWSTRRMTAGCTTATGPRGVWRRR